METKTRHRLPFSVVIGVLIGAVLIVSSIRLDQQRRDNVKRRI
ncbi:MAG: hypothetical protein ACYS8W_12180 [Planctomycetota bacterium]|jgi:hypothetical protein